MTDTSTATEQAKNNIAPRTPLASHFYELLCEEQRKIPDQTAAIDCQIILKNGYQVAGPLRLEWVAEGTTGLRRAIFCLGAVAPVGQRGEQKLVLAEHYFAEEDLAAIILVKEIPQQLVQAAGGKIWTPGAGNAR